VTARKIVVVPGNVLMMDITANAVFLFDRETAIRRVDKNLESFDDIHHGRDLWLVSAVQREQCN